MSDDAHPAYQSESEATLLGTEVCALAEEADNSLPTLMDRSHSAPTLTEEGLEGDLVPASQSALVSGYYGSRTMQPQRSILKQVAFASPERQSPVSRHSAGKNRKDALRSTHSFDYAEAKEASRIVMQRKVEDIQWLSMQSGSPSLCRTAVRSWTFEMSTAILIVSNSIFLGVQVEYYVQHGDDPVPFAFIVMQAAYTSLFTIELIMRLIGEGVMFWRTPSWGWTLLDIVVVVLSLVEPFLAMIQYTSTGAGSSPASNLRILRILRVTRLIRIVRIVKVVRFIRALRTLVQSIICTLKSLLWAMLLLLIIMYIFGIVLTDAVRQSGLDTSSAFYSEGSKAMLEMRFGNLHRSIHTLFRSVSGGLSWSETADALVLIEWTWAYIFSAYVSFCLFAVLNVMTGVFCHSAIKGAERDQDMVIQSVISETQQYLGTLDKLFKEIDDDRSGAISLDEFELHFKDEAIQAFFSALELEPFDAWTLFRQLDLNEDHCLDAEEFLEGCLKLRGAARNIDMAAVRRDGRDVSKRVKNLLECLTRVEELLDRNAEQIHSPQNRCSSSVKKGQETPRVLDAI